MKIIIAASIINNRVYINNIHNLTFTGEIIIKYNDVIIYQNNITLINKIVWFAPYLLMSDISKINVILVDDNGNEFYSATPIPYVTFMRESNEELNEICDFMKNDNINNIVEIGSYQGESTIIFSEYFKNSKVFAVDFWTNHYDDRELSINRFNMTDIEKNFDTITKDYSNIIKIKMESKNFSNIIADKSIDFIYIDGDHTYNGIYNDILNWKTKIKNGGFIGGHDYNDINKDTIIKAVEEFFPNDKINTVGPSWLIKIKNINDKF